MSRYATDDQETDAPTDEQTGQITEFPFWSEDVNGDPMFCGTHWQCDRCDAISSLGPEQIRHKDDCPLGIDPD